MANCALAATSPVNTLSQAIVLHTGRATRLALDCLFPRLCVGCGRIGSYLCDRCRARLSVLSGPLCPHCGRPQPSGILCPSCARGHFAISAIRSVFRFDGVARRAIIELKYHNLRAIAPTLSAYLAARLRDEDFAPELIVPVPLHPKRLRRRGYNQSALLARELGVLRGICVSEHSLTRTRDGDSQVRTRTAEARRDNVAGAFACTDAAVSGKRILVVDDVCTTGATLEACASVLRDAGSTEVRGLTVAREV